MQRPFFATVFGPKKHQPVFTAEIIQPAQILLRNFARPDITTLGLLALIARARCGPVFEPGKPPPSFFPGRATIGALEKFPPTSSPPRHNWDRK